MTGYGAFALGSGTTQTVVVQIPIDEGGFDTTNLDTNSLVFDRFGNRIPNERLTVLNTHNPGLLNDGHCYTEIFKLDFVGNNFGYDGSTGQPVTPHANAQDIMDVVCQVFRDVEAMIEHSKCNGDDPVVNILVISDNLTNDAALASAASYYRECGVNDNTGIIYGDVWRAINGGVNGPELDGELKIRFDLSTINPAWSWNLSPEVQATGNKFDLYSVVLHEALHILGFASLIDENGLSQLLGHYSKYDTYIQSLTSNAPFIDWDGCYDAGFNQSVPTAEITSGCANVEFLGTNIDQPVYAPSGYKEGSSLSHFDRSDCNANNAGNPIGYSVMNFSIGNGVNRKVPTVADIEALCAIGYKTTGIYGDQTLNFHTSSGIQVCGEIVAGNNDGFPNTCGPNIYVMDSDDPPIIIDILDNDIGAVNYTCLTTTPIEGTGVAAVFNPTKIRFTPQDPGIVILQYIPVGPAPNFIKGNPTCVRIVVNPADGITCANLLNCNQICNPNFTNNLNGWSTYGTPQQTTTTGSPNPGIASMWCSNLIAQPDRGESIITPVETTSGGNYLFSYYRN